MNEATENDGGTWHDVAARDQLDPDFPTGVVVGAEKIGLFLLDEQVHALEDVCPHAYALLSQGFQEDGHIECPLHEARFEIATGKCKNEIGQRDLKCYPVRVNGAGRVEVKIPVVAA
ncbi:MAG: non-heme iron oxygenase ferredoxin subunit [Burkholderiaceae bacterium]|nr:non-heme iron oxygenase ferredoxin subunit [Burkholderiaceae bacterium]